MWLQWEIVIILHIIACIRARSFPIQWCHFIYVLTVRTYMKVTLTIKLLPSQDKFFSIKYNTVTSHEVFCTRIKNSYNSFKSISFFYFQKQKLNFLVYWLGKGEMKQIRIYPWLKIIIFLNHGLLHKEFKLVPVINQLDSMCSIHLI
jgi:hypothetical protein